MTQILHTQPSQCRQLLGIPHSGTSSPRCQHLDVQRTKTTPQSRAEHLGSLLRPSRLLNKRHAIQQNKETGADLAQLEDDSINEIVQVQNDCGIHSVSDGEYRRHMFWGTFFPTLNGMKEIFNPDPKIFREYVPDIAAFLEDEKVPGESVICDGKISHTGQSSYIGQFEYLKKIVPKERHGEIKMTLAAPNWYHLRYKEGMAYPKEVYSSDEEYFADIAKAYQTELQILYDAGLRNAQVDDPNLACKSLLSAPQCCGHTHAIPWRC